MSHLFDAASLIAGFAQDVLIGRAFLALIAYSILLCGSMAMAERVRSLRSGHRLWKDPGPAAAVGITSVGTLLVWITLSAVTLALARLVHSATSYEALSCLIAYSAAPSLAVMLFYPVAGLSWLANRAYAVLLTLSAVWSTWLLWRGFGVLTHVMSWREALVATPGVAALWAGIAIFYLEGIPTYLATRRWRRLEGRRTVVFVPRVEWREDYLSTVTDADNALLLP